jgi:mannose-6-phosphate isomerase-like protein (cupin superfamily)
LEELQLKPGLIVHVPAGVAHSIKAEGGELTLVDFAQPPFDPNKMEWIK